VPCCNFWSRSTRLGRDQLLDAIEQHHASCGPSERVILNFSGPHNRALVLLPDPALYAGGAVDALPEQVRVAIVARVLLDHVDINPA